MLYNNHKLSPFLARLSSTAVSLYYLTTSFLWPTYRSYTFYFILHATNAQQQLLNLSSYGTKLGEPLSESR